MSALPLYIRNDMSEQRQVLYVLSFTDCGRSRCTKCESGLFDHVYPLIKNLCVGPKFPFISDFPRSSWDSGDNQ